MVMALGTARRIRIAYAASFAVACGPGAGSSSSGASGSGGGSSSSTSAMTDGASSAGPGFGTDAGCSDGQISLFGHCYDRVLVPELVAPVELASLDAIAGGLPIGGLIRPDQNIPTFATVTWSGELRVQAGSDRIQGTGLVSGIWSAGAPRSFVTAGNGTPEGTLEHVVQADGSFETRPHAMPLAEWTAELHLVSALDADGDGVDELVMFEQTGEPEYPWYGRTLSLQADAWVFKGERLPVRDYDTSIAATRGDVDRDGTLELLVGDEVVPRFPADGPLRHEHYDPEIDQIVVLGSGTGAAQERARVPAGTVPYGLATGDVDGDGTLDVVVRGWDRTTILTGAGDGTFRDAVELSVPPYELTGGDRVTEILCADLDGDGVDELVASVDADGQPPGDVIAVAMATTDPVLTVLRRDPGITAIAPPFLADVNLDSVLDIAYVVSVDGSVIVELLLSDG